MFFIFMGAAERKEFQIDELQIEKVTNTDTKPILTIVQSTKISSQQILDDEENYKEDVFLDIVSDYLSTVFMNLSSNFHLGQHSITGIGSFDIRKYCGKLRIDRIQAPGYGKMIMFYIIACAINHNLKEVELKAEPIGPKERRKTLEDLITFYSSFGFKRVEDLNNGVKMNLKLNDENIAFLLKRLGEFVNC